MTQQTTICRTCGEPANSISPRAMVCSAMPHGTQSTTQKENPMAKQATAAGGNTEAAAAVSVAEHVAEGQKGPFSTLLDHVPWYDLAAGRYISAAENPGGTPAGANEAGAK